MNRELQDICLGLLRKWQFTKDDEIRNELYTKLMPFLLKWIKSICRRKRYYYSEEELLSLTWEYFLIGIDSYENWEIPLPIHFMNTIEWHLVGSNKKDKRLEKKFVPLEDEVEEKVERLQCGIISSDSFLTEFRSYLPEQERQIFDSAFTGQISRDNSIPVNKFYAARRVFRHLIKFFLSIS